MYHYHISDSHRNTINNTLYNEIHYDTITMKFQLYLDNYIYLFIGEQNAILIRGGGGEGVNHVKRDWPMFINY